MKYTVVVLLLLSIAASCGTESREAETDAKPTKEKLIADVKAYEDTLKTQGASQAGVAGVNDYADYCLAVYRNYPKSEEAPTYLDKAHVVLSSAGLHGAAVMYADTLIRKYPTYKNRPMVLQSLASAYDLFILPRKKEKVKYYYELLLKENKSLPTEEKEQIELRLKHVDLTFDQFLEVQMQESRVASAKSGKK